VYTDRTITCLDCGQEFTFTAGEQEFYAQRGFTEAPKRCPSDRALRKAQRSRGNASYDGADASAWGRSSSEVGAYSPAYAGGPAGYSSGGGYRERRPRELFEAVCADCGKTASVPFRPSGSKPVYCSDCFQNHR
jgi:CxxC-x17-CxxC domain-containing protein